MTKTRTLAPSDIARIGEIDRSEHITEEYVLRDGSLSLVEVDVRAARWPASREHVESVPAKIAEWSPYLDAGGTLVGAFEEDRLVGFAIYRPDIEPGVGQLVALYVSEPQRGTGVGRALCEAVTRLASDDGARELYVSATPTGPTVRFYQSNGFVLTSQPNPDLLTLEPKDIHMRRML